MIAAEPEQYDLRFKLAELEFALKHLDKGEEVLKEIISLDKLGPNSLKARDELARLYVVSKRLDEARVLVKEVIEHIQGSPVDVNAAIAAEAAKPTAKGAGLLAKYNAQNDSAALAAYQLVAEGRAEAVWNEMADCIEDKFVSGAYAKIAKDEGFHSKIGARKLEQLATDSATQARIELLVSNMRRDLYDISCRNTVAAEAGRELVADAYGW